MLLKSRLGWNQNHHEGFKSSR